MLRRVGMQWVLALSTLALALLPLGGVRAIKVGMIGDSGDAAGAQRVFKMMRDAGVDLVLDVGDLDYRNDPGRWNKFLEDHWFNSAKSRSFLAVSGDHETLFDGNGRWDIGGDDTYRVRLWRSLSDNSNLGLQNKCRGRDGRALKDEFGKFTTCETDNVFVALIGWDEQQFHFAEELTFLRQRFAATSAKWRICVWHRPEGAYQGRGGEDQDQGRLEAYDICREGGAVVYTGHAHNYQRSKLMADFKRKTVSSRHRLTSAALRCGDNGESFAVNTGIAGRSMTGTNYLFAHSATEFGGDRARELGIPTDSRGAVMCDFGADQAVCGLSVVGSDDVVHMVDPWTMTSSCGSGGVPSPIPSPIPNPVPSPVPNPVPSPVPNPVPSPVPNPVPSPVPNPVPSPVRVPSTMPSRAYDIEPVCNQGDGTYRLTETTGGEIRPLDLYLYLRAPVELVDADTAWIAVTYLHPETRPSVREFAVEYNSASENYHEAVLAQTHEQTTGAPPPAGDKRWTGYVRLRNARFARQQNCQADLRLASVDGMRIETISMSFSTPPDITSDEPEAAGPPLMTILVGVVATVAVAAAAAVAIVIKRRAASTDPFSGSSAKGGGVMPQPYDNRMGGQPQHNMHAWR